MSDHSRYARQKYIDIPIAEVDQTTHPICQLKYDGIWCQCDVDSLQTGRYFSRHGECKKIEKLSPLVPEASFVGELMYGSEWSKEESRSGLFYVFDLVESVYGCHRNQPYHERYARLQELFLANALPRHWHLVPNYPTSESLNIWELLITTGRYEGLVFRNLNHTWHTPVLRSKFELTVDLYITGFIEGEGRLRGTLGAVKASYSPLGVGVELTIGGGFTDALRKRIWNDQDSYMGRCFVCTAKKKFKSGLLRHPNFSKWHEEK